MPLVLATEPLTTAPPCRDVTFSCWSLWLASRCGSTTIQSLSIDLTFSEHISHCNSMSNAKNVRNCKHCMTEISRRAKVCPQCLLPNSFFGAMKGLVKTGGWFISTCFAGLFGIVEYVEKIELERQKGTIEDTLILAESNLKAIEELFPSSTSAAPVFQSQPWNYPANEGNPTTDKNLRMGASPEKSIDVDNSRPDRRNQDREQLEAQLAEVMSNHPVNRAQVEVLTKKLARLRYGR